MTAAPHAPSRRQGGFSLVELLVGVLIAMVGVLIMTQTLLNSEERNRTTTSGTEALSNGAVMLHLLTRDLSQGGYGLNATRLLGCNLTLPGGAVVPLAPVLILPAASTLLPTADASTDRLYVAYGNDNGQPEGNPVLSVNASNYVVQSPAAFSVGDWVVATPDTCPGGGLALQRVTAVDALQVTTNSAALASATVLHNLGRNPRFVGYIVRNQALQTCDFMAGNGTTACGTFNAANWTSISPNIPSLRALYGRDTNAGTMDGAADLWDQTTPATGAGATCNWARITGVRVAVVSRSSAFETQIDSTSGERVCQSVTTDALAPTWAGSSLGVPLNMPGTDWRCYRYRTYETVTPMRNVIWAGNQGGTC